MRQNKSTGADVDKGTTVLPDGLLRKYKPLSVIAYTPCRVPKSPVRTCDILLNGSIPQPSTGVIDRNVDRCATNSS